MEQTENSFEHGMQFARAQDSGNLRLGRLELMYEELFAEVIEDGVITPEERRRLDRMAENFGLDRARLGRLENALQAAYEARHQIAIQERPSAPPAASVSFGTGALDGNAENAGDRFGSGQAAALSDAYGAQALSRAQSRIVALEARIVELEAALEDARAHVNVEVDLSGCVAAVAPLPSPEDSEELVRRLQHDPRDQENLHGLFALLGSEPERRFAVAHVLTYLGIANEPERLFFEQHRPKGLIRPTRALSQEAWQRLLFHPEEEALVGEIFSVVVSAVLLGRVSTLRRDKALVKLELGHKQDPEQSTLQSVRCMHWAAAILGLKSPDIYADPAQPGAIEMVLGMPPVSRLGKQALAGRSAATLAFLAGKHLAHFREEHFVKLVVPGVRGLEDVFLASLTIGNPGLPLNAQMKQLVRPIASAIEPVLEPSQVDRLRGGFLRFVEAGGRTNLQRWSSAVERTCNRAGLLLCGDLHAAEEVLRLESHPHLQESMDDLLRFVLSARHEKLRKQLGVALES
jgi:hypothetical protein